MPPTLVKKSVQPCLPLYRLVLWLTALSLVIIGAKLWLIQAYGTPVPYGDQWVEAEHFLQPWVEGRLTWAAWFAPHNEHRIFFTRLLDLVCLKLNGTWDPGLQMVVNAFIHAGVICGLVAGLWFFGRRKDQGLFCLLLAPFFALPLAAENTLWGFQSQFYFLLLSAIVTMAGLGFHRPGSKWWWLGLAAAGLSLVTMASGLLASLAVAGLLGLRWLKQRRLHREDLITVAGCLAVFIAGVLLYASAARAEPQAAHSGGAIVAALAWNLAWPFENRPVMLLFTCLPLAITAVKYFKGDFKNLSAAEFVLTLGFWGLLQSAALAYGRNGEVNCSRYADLFCIIPIASLASLFLLGEGESFERISRSWMTVLAAGWVGILLFGLWRTAPMNWQDLGDAGNYPLWSAQTRLVEEENIRAFVVTGDPESLRHNFNRTWLTNALLNPNFSRIMPPACRPALALEKGEGSDALFVPDGCPPERPPQEYARAWGSYSTGKTVATGRFISQPLTTTLPKLELQLCCAPTMDNLSIQLIEEGSQRRTRILPQVLGQWHTVSLAAPNGSFRLEITDQNPDAWVAVGDLKETGRFSSLVRSLINHGVLLLLTGLGLFVGLAGHDVIRGVTELHHYPVIRWLALLAALWVFMDVWPARHFDATKNTCELYANCAKNFSAAGQTKEARRLLYEALWLRPDDERLKKQMRALAAPSPVQFFETQKIAD